jgi:nucleotide-binding universal stress UspA family protein
MNTRGLMELVILNIGRDLGVITDAVFAMMVIMAIVTTALTTPILHWVYPQAEAEAELLKAKAKAAEKRFRVLIPVALPASGGPLAAMAALLTPAADITRTIIALSLRRPVDRDAFRAGLADADVPVSSLSPLLDEAKKREIAVETVSFVSRDIPSDIARVARVREADLILMGFHKPVFGQAILGGTVHRVMTGSDSDVAVFVDRGTESLKTVMVPYLGGKHDRLALDLAGRIARNSSASLTVLHVVKPRRDTEDSVLHAQSIVNQTFADPTQPTPVTFKVIEDPSPVDVVVNEAKNFDMVVIGVEEEWGLASHLFGWRPERVARETRNSLLIVRKYTAPAAAKLPILETPQLVEAGTASPEKDAAAQKSET